MLVPDQPDAPDLAPDLAADLDIAVVRLDPDLPLPSYAHPGDAGADLHTTVDLTLGPGERALVPTGLSIALPDGYVALVHPRSGLAARHGLSIVNTPGTVDAGYRGEIKVMLINHDRDRVGVALPRGPDRAAGDPAVRACPVRRGGGPAGVGPRRRGLRFYGYRRATMSRFASKEMLT